MHERRKQALERADGRCLVASTLALPWAVVAHVLHAAGSVAGAALPFTAPRTERVEPGDTMHTHAERARMSVRELQRANSLRRVPAHIP